MTDLENEAAAAYDRFIAAARGSASPAAVNAARAEWSHLAAAADHQLAASQTASRSAGICWVCRRVGFQPWQLDDSARCLECQP